MNPDARRYEAVLRLHTRTVPTVLTAIAVCLTGYLTYQAPEQWRDVLTLWAGLLFVGACLGGTEAFARLGLNRLSRTFAEVKRSPADQQRLSAATQGLADASRPCYPVLVELGQAPVLLAAHGGRLFVSTRALFGLEPAQLRVLMLQALEKLSFGVMVERILFTAVLWWIPALTLFRSPLGLPLTIAGALALVISQLILQEWLYQREGREADGRVLEQVGQDQLAPAIANLLALHGPAARQGALARIMALGIPESEAQSYVKASFER